MEPSRSQARLALRQEEMRTRDQARDPGECIMAKLLSINRWTTQVEDDPDFLALVERVVANLVLALAPKEIYRIRINNWFDHKWLRFSGMGVVDLRSCYPWFDVALDEVNQESLTFPPFTPERVMTQRLYCREADGSYAERIPPRLTHLPHIGSRICVFMGRFGFFRQKSPLHLRCVWVGWAGVGRGVGEGSPGGVRGG